MKNKVLSAINNYAGAMAYRTFGVAAVAGIAIAPPLLGAYNKAKTGPISYKAEMDGMTGKYRNTAINSGTVGAMHNAAQGDPVIFQDMAKHVINSSVIGPAPVENYGVDADFISAFYGM